MKKNILATLLIFTPLLFACQKDFLDKKSDQSLLVPTTFADMQAMLDNHAYMNDVPALGVMGSDNFYTTDAGWAGYSSAIERNAYIWADDVYEGLTSVSEWNRPYRQVFYANIVLLGLEKMEEVKDSTAFKTIEGQALFFRGHAFYQLCQLFCEQYKKGTDAKGIVLKLTPEVGEQVSRSSLQQSYDQMIKDLEMAVALLPNNSTAVSRPSKTAALGLLSRIYLIMGDWQTALNYSNLVLSIKNNLLDYKSLSITAGQPFPIALPNNNAEVLWYGAVSSFGFTIRTNTLIDTLLYKSYAPNDLRKVLYFIDRGKGVVNMKGKYTGTVLLFGGIAMDEIYLIKAECLARLDKLGEATDVLNNLLATRWKANTYVPFGSNDSKIVLRKILDERRKELIARGLRWTDLRRLNKDPDFAITIFRKLNGMTYELKPQSLKYVWPIPDNEIRYSGIEQNPR